MKSFLLTLAMAMPLLSGCSTVQPSIYPEVELIMVAQDPASIFGEGGNVTATVVSRDDIYVEAGISAPPGVTILHRDENFSGPMTDGERRTFTMRVRAVPGTVAFHAWANPTQMFSDYSIAKALIVTGDWKSASVDITRYGAYIKGSIIPTSGSGPNATVTVRITSSLPMQADVAMLYMPGNSEKHRIRLEANQPYEQSFVVPALRDTNFHAWVIPDRAVEVNDYATPSATLRVYSDGTWTSAPDPTGTVSDFPD